MLPISRISTTAKPPMPPIRMAGFIAGSGSGSGSPALGRASSSFQPAQKVLSVSGWRPSFNAASRYLLRLFTHASARARVTLDGPAECSLDDGARDAVLSAGAHTVTVRCPDVTAPTTLSLTGGETRVLRVSYRDRRGPPLYVPLATAGLSLAALTVGLLRGAAASSKHDELEAAGCATRGSDACRDIASGGRAAELQANVSYVVAGVLGAATIGLFVWHRRGEITLAPSPRQATLRLAVAWP